MGQISSPLHRDEALEAFDVQCSCAAGEHDEEPTADFEVVVPLAGAFVRRSTGGTWLVDPAFGYVARPDSAQEITHVSHGDRCVAVVVTPVLADELGLGRARPWLVVVDRPLQRRLARALAAAAAADALVAGEAWLDVIVQVGARPAALARMPRATVQRAAAVARVREAIAADPGAAWTMPGLAAVAGYAPHHLSRVFRGATGMSVSEYRDRVRLGRAIALLRDGMPVAEVASATGYCDHAHLTRRATQLLGAPPSALRSPDRAPMSKRPG